MASDGKKRHNPYKPKKSNMNYYVSQEGYEELKKELESLKSDARREVAEDLKRAKEYGDLSENSEYAEARQKQTVIESRIFELEEMLKNASIIKKSGTGEQVEVGSTVSVKKNGKALVYQIVGSSESNPAENKISNESPLGRSFLGKRAGEKVEVTTPSGASVYEITSIS